MKIKNNRAINEIIEPNDETTFHLVYASGQSEYRRGIPLKPKKCWGKKVKLTPKNIIKKWIFAHRECKVMPENSGNQWLNAAKIANTAPILNT